MVFNINGAKSHNNVLSFSENSFFSYNLGYLPEGCKYCVQGRKTVVYITGLCPRQCYYCPLSEQKKDKDVMFANEKQIYDSNEVVEECKLSSSTGVGITGGDPLLTLDRTIDCIKLLKTEFGNDFHIHLYTSLDLLEKESLQKLFDSGLDEIRVHPDLYDKKLWPRIKLLSEFDWDFGIEIPAIPGREEFVKDLLNTYYNFIQFINLNEFEYSDTNNDALHEHNYFCISEDTYAIKGSNSSAFEIMSYVQENLSKLRVHFCTAKLKDATQISNRLKLRSKNIAKNLDVVDEEGMLIRGVIKTNDFDFIETLAEKYDIPDTLIEADEERSQILIAGWVLEEIAKDLDFKCELVTEYPTADRMIVEVLPLNY